MRGPEFENRHLPRRSPDFGYLGDIDAISARTVFLVGGRSSLTVSTDGKITWSVVQPPLGSTAGGTSQVIFFAPDHGIVVGDDDNNNETRTIWSTTDGGNTWTGHAPRP